MNEGAGTGAGSAVVALAVAALLHYALARAGRRLPLWWTRRHGLPLHAGRPVRRATALVAAGLQAVVWLAALGWAIARIPELARVRDAGVAMVSAGLRAPLFSVDTKPFSALDLLALPLELLAVWFGVGWAVRALRSWLAALTGAEGGLLETAAALGRYLLAGLGFLLVLQVWGVDVRSLAILASVLGVGIGFGLQNIANNFVSGLLINVGRPIQPGDFVDVGRFSGTVQRIGARSTEILTTDEVAILIPNSRFLEQEVVNWSHLDPRCRLHVPVGVAYGSDVRLVRRALLAAAADHPGVLRDPRASVQMRGFGASSLDFDLLVWTSDPRRQQELVSDLFFRVEESLRRHGIEIPVPQRDLTLRSPTLEQLVAAWRDPAAFAAARERDRTAPAPPAPPTGWERERGPEHWEEGELAEVARRLRSAGGVAVRDRRHLLSVYPRCFVGREAVDWLVAHEGLSRGESVTLGQRLLELGEIRHVLDEHDFRDGHLFYRFRGEDEPRLSVTGAPTGPSNGPWRPDPRSERP
jgi:potassium-dependent mechanosensitive channel